MSPNQTTRNQIDYIRLPKSFRKDVKSAKTYPGADVGSDHNPVVIEMKLKFRKKIKPKSAKRIDIRKVTKNPDTRRKVAGEMAKALRDQEDDVDVTQPREKWKKAQRETQEKVIGTTVSNEEKETVDDG